MPGWIVVAAIGSIVATALLTFVFWRMNAPAFERAKRRGGGVVPAGDTSVDRKDALNDDGSDGGGD